jgi:hypothetical protein
MRHALILSLSMLAAMPGRAQDETGRIQGTVIDSLSRQPVKKATVSVDGTDVRGNQLRAVITDASGSFEFDALSPRSYLVTVYDDNYPQGRTGGVRKTVQVSAGDTASSVSIEMIPVP